MSVTPSVDDLHQRNSVVNKLNKDSTRVVHYCIVLDVDLAVLVITIIIIIRVIVVK